MNLNAACSEHALMLLLSSSVCHHYMRCIRKCENNDLRCRLIYLVTVSIGPFECGCWCSPSTLYIASTQCFHFFSAVFLLFAINAQYNVYYILNTLTTTITTAKKKQAATIIALGLEFLFHFFILPTSAFRFICIHAHAQAQAHIHTNLLTFYFTRSTNCP